MREDIEPLTISSAALELDFYRAKRQGKVKGERIERDYVLKVRDYLKEKLEGIKKVANGETFSYFVHKDPVVASLLEFYHGGISLREYGETVEDNTEKAFSNFAQGLEMITDEFDKFLEHKSKMKISDISTLVKFCITLSREAAISEERKNEYPFGKRYIA